MTIDEIKMKVIDLEWAVMEKNSVDRRYFQQEIFDEIQNLHTWLQESEQERDLLRTRVKWLEADRNDLMVHCGFIKENPVEMETHPSPEEPDDPLPFWDLDHESIAPAEEVEGADE